MEQNMYTEGEYNERIGMFPKYGLRQQMLKVPWIPYVPMNKSWKDPSVNENFWMSSNAGKYHTWDFYWDDIKHSSADTLKS